MKLVILSLLLILSTLVTPSAKAQSLLGDSCIGEESLQVSNSLMAQKSSRNSVGLTCADLRAVSEAAEIVHMAVMPAMAVGSAAVSGAFAAELAALGIAGTPAVLVVTVIGYYGVNTINILLKKSLEDCDRSDAEVLKAQFNRELDARFGMKSSAQTTLKVTP